MAVESQNSIKLAKPSFIPGQAYPVTILEPHWVLTTAPKEAQPLVGDASHQPIALNSSSWDVPTDTNNRVS